MFEAVQTEVISTTRFDENSYSNMTYLGRVDMTRASKIKEEEKFHGMECQMLLEE